jgi:hypothetical protein
MSTTSHEKAEFQALLDSASHYIVAHGAGAGLELLPPVWDDGAPSMSSPVHHVVIATSEAEVDLPVPHEWLPLDSDGHNRFRTEVEIALAELRARRRSS